ncbi:glycoside hydrolase family 5 protein [Dyella jejuensis]
MLSTWLTLFAPALLAADLMAFWDTPRHGGNSFNRLPPDEAYFRALKKYGASWVRVSYDKWRPTQRDFLLGNADRYQGLVASDLATLQKVLDNAQAAGLKVVVVPLSLPGMRWSQNNRGKFDDRLWRDKRYQQEAAQFWRDLASALKDHPAVAAYDLINEPAPEKHGDLYEHASAAAMQAWYRKARGTARDLPAFYTMLAKAIREIDATTPIMVESGWYGAADDFAYWPAPLDDAHVLYSFHMYEPYAFTSAPNLRRAVPYTYPGRVPFAGRLENWNRERIDAYLRQPLQWARARHIPMNRIVMGEFGCVRRVSGCVAYLDDVLSVADRAGIHWAFYSFREDSWDAMDYELGDAKVPWSYWKAIDEGRPDPLERHAMPAFEPIRRRLPDH